MTTSSSLSKPLIGMVLAPGKRTVSAALRVMGLGATRDFALYHYVLSRARWRMAAAHGGDGASPASSNRSAG